MTDLGPLISDLGPASQRERQKEEGQPQPDLVCHGRALYLGGRSPVRKVEPATQMVRRFVGRAPIEGHQRARAARGLGDLRTPFVEADGRHFDTILAAIDDLFEMMHGHGDSAASKTLKKTVHSSARCRGLSLIHI